MENKILEGEECVSVCSGKLQDKEVLLKNARRDLQGELFPQKIHGSGIKKNEN